jgi:hypothetical protein
MTTEKEFNLSKRLDEHFDFAIKTGNCSSNVADEIMGDVKEFIKRLKEINFTKRKHNVLHSIDKLSGNELKEEK